MANTKYAVYKIFNGSDFDTIYFKAPALAITESDDKQFISKANKALITSYLTDFNDPNKLVRLGTDGKIPAGLINESFSNYLDKRSASGLQNVGSEVNFEHANGITVEHGINLNAQGAVTSNINRLYTHSTGVVKLSIGNDAEKQEITFAKAGTLDFTKPTEIKNVKLGADNSAVPKSYVDTVIESGAKPIETVVAATAASFDPMPSGITLTPDTVPVKAGDRVLLKDQLDKTKNGIYVVSTGDWTRVSEDSNLNGALVFVKEGKDNNDSKWFHKGGGEWIRFSQTDQLQFTDGLVRSDDTVTLLKDYITNDHIEANAAIDVSKLGVHSGSSLNWDANDVASGIASPTSIDKRLTDLAMTVYRIRGDVSTGGAYGEWRTGAGGSLSISAVNTIATAKQNPVRWGTSATPSTTNYKDGDVYLHTDS